MQLRKKKSLLEREKRMQTQCTKKTLESRSQLFFLLQRVHEKLCIRRQYAFESKFFFVLLKSESLNCLGAKKNLLKKNLNFLAKSSNFSVDYHLFNARAFITILSFKGALIRNCALIRIWIKVALIELLQSILDWALIIKRGR